MSADVLSGTELAAAIRARTAAAAAESAERGRPPRLAVVVATAEDSTAWYVRSIAGAARRVGVDCAVVDLGPAAGTAQIRDTLDELAADDAVHGVILQTPLPAGVDAADLVTAIPVGKDVDGASPASLGRLVAGQRAFAPATAEAVVALLAHAGRDLAGRHAVVVGRSTVVGKPLAHLLLDRDATVTVCHSRTKSLAEHTRSADLIVAAAGRIGLVTAAHVRPGAVVVDVGTNPTYDGRLLGDVDAESVAAVAGALTPVPGGVGPVTTALLLEHTVIAATQPPDRA
jgi:methylenetetrahydrofolate dehydrogenase (NADP+)/methenyltetrahydrofolate cyclohydrolase